MANHEPAFGHHLAFHPFLYWCCISFYLGWRIGHLVDWSCQYYYVPFCYLPIPLLLKSVFYQATSLSLFLRPGRLEFWAWLRFTMYFINNEVYNNLNPSRIFRFSILYASFAFIISAIREAIKDMEDIEGDARYGCKTLPIVAGLNAAKTYTIVWLVVLIGALVIVQVYALQFSWWLAILYCTLFIIVPCCKIGESID